MIVVRPLRSSSVKASPSSVFSRSSGAGVPGATIPTRRLPAQAELANQRAVALEVLLLQVVEQAPALADQHEQAAARMVVLLVVAQVLREVVDALGEQRDLDPGVARVLRGGAELRDELGLALLGQRHAAGQSISSRSTRGRPARRGPSARSARPRTGTGARRAGACGTRSAAGGRRDRPRSRSGRPR